MKTRYINTVRILIAINAIILYTPRELYGQVLSGIETKSLLLDGTGLVPFYRIIVYPEMYHDRKVATLGKLLLYTDRLPTSFGELGIHSDYRQRQLEGSENHILVNTEKCYDIIRAHNKWVWIVGTIRNGAHNPYHIPACPCILEVESYALWSEIVSYYTKLSND